MLLYRETVHPFHFVLYSFLTSQGSPQLNVVFILGVNIKIWIKYMGINVPLDGKELIN